MSNYSNAYFTAKRDGNNKRKYLLVNRLQGKHVPCKASEAIKMFAALAAELPELEDEKVLVIGFAETATAIAQQIAVCRGWDVICTTREDISKPFVTFSEDHSHATEHKIRNIDYSQYDTYVIVDDEITTGNTIKHLISALTLKKKKKKIIACLRSNLPGDSLENWPVYSLVHNTEDYVCEDYKYGSYSYKQPLQDAMRIHRFDCSFNPWDLHKPEDFQLPPIYAKNFESQKVCVMGAEEFMYPAIHIAESLEVKGVDVVTQSLTRSPISVGKGFELFSRAEVPSSYDVDRVNYFYNEEDYDTIILVTSGKYYAATAHVLQKYADDVMVIVYAQ